MKRNKFFSWLDSRVLIFIIILVVIVLANVVINIFFEADKNNYTFNIRSYRNYNSYETDKNIIDCIIKEELDSECRTLFSSPGIADECRKIEDTKTRDNCFEKAGINSLNSAYCQEILNEKIKENCFMESAFPNEINNTLQISKKFPEKSPTSD